MTLLPATETRSTMPRLFVALAWIRLGRPAVRGVARCVRGQGAAGNEWRERYSPGTVAGTVRSSPAYHSFKLNQHVTFPLLESAQ
jgi:hypothetical protein